MSPGSLDVVILSLTHAIRDVLSLAMVTPGCLLLSDRRKEGKKEERDEDDKSGRC